MPFRLIADGSPITDWEDVRARDVDLWIDAVRKTEGLDRTVRVTAQGRTDSTYADPSATASDSMSKSELLAMVDGLGLDAPKGATKAQLVDLING